MKKKLILIIVLTASILSCTEEKVYSCNEDVNEWVISNLSSVKEMSRTDWIKLDDIQKQAVYNAFSPEQKVKFWEEKFTETKQMDWSPEELSHIIEAEDFFKTHKHFFYKKLTDEDLNELELFAYLWVKKGVEVLGWMDKVGLSIIATGDSLQDTKGNTLKSNFLPNENENEKPNCNCHGGNLITVCNASQEYCEESDCNTGNYCGILLLEECNGTCKY